MLKQHYKWCGVNERVHTINGVLSVVAWLSNEQARILSNSGYPGREAEVRRRTSKLVNVWTDGVKTGEREVHCNEITLFVNEIGLRQ
jgi:hypothetical protein